MYNHTGRKRLRRIDQIDRKHEEQVSRIKTTVTVGPAGESCKIKEVTRYARSIQERQYIYAEYKEELQRVSNTLFGISPLQIIRDNAYLDSIYRIVQGEVDVSLLITLRHQLCRLSTTGRRGYLKNIHSNHGWPNEPYIIACCHWSDIQGFVDRNWDIYSTRISERKTFSQQTLQQARVEFEQRQYTGILLYRLIFYAVYSQVRGIMGITFPTLNARGIRFSDKILPSGNGTAGVFASNISFTIPGVTWGIDEGSDIMFPLHALLLHDDYRAWYRSKLHDLQMRLVANADLDPGVIQYLS